MSTLQMTYRDFCNKYYAEAKRVAEIAINTIRKNQGSINPRIDVEWVKEMGITRALENVYEKFDVDNEKGATIKTFLDRCVYNAVLSELSKEATACGVKKKSGMEAVDASGKAYRFSEPLDYEKHYYEAKREKKEETLDKIQSCILKLKARDQQIVNLWAEDKSTYVEKALALFGWEDNESNRRKIYLYFNKAKKQIRDLMTAQTSTYAEGAIHSYKNANALFGAGQEIRLDVNAARRRQRLVHASRTSGINYALICESIYEEIIK